MIIENLLRVQIVQAVRWFDTLTMSGSTFRSFLRETQDRL
jgi:hypothetical protein